LSETIKTKKKSSGYPENSGGIPHFHLRGELLNYVLIFIWNAFFLIHFASKYKVL